MKKIFESKLTANILMVVSILIYIAFGYIGLKINNSGNDLVKTGSKNSGLIVFLIILLVINIFAIIIFNIIGAIRRKKEKEKDVIKILCSLQNEYLMNPQFVTSKKHGQDSKEKDLSEGGIAKILTNSLTYDIFFTSEIADNIICGAKYIYILPNTPIVIRELRDYITKIGDYIFRNKAKEEEEFRKILSERIEFWFFDKSISCLYNFAVFRQVAERDNQPFTQSWWYINPPDAKPESYMLSREIQSKSSHQSELENVFETLEKFSKISGMNKNGLEIYDNRRRLREVIGEE